MFLLLWTLSAGAAGFATVRPPAIQPADQQTIYPPNSAKRVELNGNEENE